MVKKTWKQKLEVSKDVEVKIMDRDWGGCSAGSKMLILTPKVVKEYIEDIPKGTSKTIEELRKDLAKKYGAHLTCPMSTGIFVRIVAEAALEDMHSGADVSKITPFWRVIDPKAPIVKKLSCGPDFINRMRKEESI